ncbi:MAG: hypothetical protein MJZ98_03240 [Paludibacteraceae bacterium]|nr:hypothetical protein [Paludibacteraceae bacterium]
MIVLENLKTAFQSIWFQIASIALREVGGEATVCLKTVSKPAKFTISAFFVGETFGGFKKKPTFVAQNSLTKKSSL